MNFTRWHNSYIADTYEKLKVAAASLNPQTSSLDKLDECVDELDTLRDRLHALKWIHTVATDKRLMPLCVRPLDLSNHPGLWDVILEHHYASSSLSDEEICRMIEELANTDENASILIHAAFSPQSDNDEVMNIMRTARSNP